jgi:hypothetical protein
MKTKALKKLLIEKSDEINIKDLSQSIVLRAQKEVIISPQKEKSTLIFQYKPAYVLLLVVLLVFSFFIISPKEYSFAYQISQNEEDIILTSISTLQIGTSDIIGLLSIDEEPMIQSQISNMNEYILWMELLFNQEDNKFIQKELPIENAIKHYSFTTKALDDQIIVYEFIIFNQNRSYQRLNISGLITHDSDSFPFELTISTKNKKSFEMIVHITDEIFIQTRFLEQSGKRDYDIQIYENESMMTQMTLNRFLENQKTVLDLTINKGNIDGSFRFRRDNDALNVTYSIANLDRSESGTMRIEIKNESEEKTFQIEIKPQGRNPVVIETPRPPVRPNPPKGRGN